MREKLFKLSLGAANITAAEFARRNDVSRQAVCQCLKHPETSTRLRSAIDRFIASQLPKVKDQLEQYQNAA